MHFYDSVVVFERGTHTKKWAPQVGKSASLPGKQRSAAKANYGRSIRYFDLILDVDVIINYLIALN